MEDGYDFYGSLYSKPMAEAPVEYDVRNTSGTADKTTENSQEYKFSPAIAAVMEKMGIVNPADSQSEPSASPAPEIPDAPSYTPSSFNSFPRAPFVLRGIPSGFLGVEFEDEPIVKTDNIYDTEPKSALQRVNRLIEEQRLERRILQETSLNELPESFLNERIEKILDRDNIVNSKDKIASITDLQIGSPGPAINFTSQVGDMFATNVGGLQPYDIPISRPTSFALRGIESRATEQKIQSEKQAHRFRTSRLGLLHEALRQVRGMDSVMDDIRAFTSNRQGLLRGTEEAGSMHRKLTPFLTGVMANPEGRKHFVRAIDTISSQESEDLKEQAREKDLTADVVIIGAGVNGAILAAQLRADKPDINIITIDKSDRLGGQFRSYGDRPVFRINSRNFRRQNNAVAELPGRDGNLNSFGPKAVVQLTDFTYDTYPTNLELGETAAINQFFSARTMLGVEYAGHDEQVVDGKSIQLMKVVDSETNETFAIQADMIVAVPGLGERKVKSEYGKVVTAEDVLKHFGNPSNKFPMARFAGKSIGIMGAGDTGRVVAELMVRAMDSETYGRSTVQMGGPNNIIWFGTDFANQQEFCDKNRSRYIETLKPYIANAAAPQFDVSFSQNLLKIFPAKNKVARWSEFDSGVKIVLDSGFDRRVDILIDARDLQPDVINELLDYSPIRSINPVTETSDVFRGQGGVEVGKRLGSSAVLLAGPAARFSLTESERRTFAEGIKENTASIWANGPRTRVLSQRIIRQLSE